MWTGTCVSPGSCPRGLRAVEGKGPELVSALADMERRGGQREGRGRDTSGVQRSSPLGPRLSFQHTHQVLTERLPWARHWRHRIYKGQCEEKSPPCATCILRGEKQTWLRTTRPYLTEAVTDGGGGRGRGRGGQPQTPLLSSNRAGVPALRLLSDVGGGIY